MDMARYWIWRSILNLLLTRYLTRAWMGIFLACRARIRSWPIWSYHRTRYLLHSMSCFPSTNLKPYLLYHQLFYIMNNTTADTNIIRSTVLNPYDTDTYGARVSQKILEFLKLRDGDHSTLEGYENYRKESENIATFILQNKRGENKLWIRLKKAEYLPSDNPEINWQVVSIEVEILHRGIIKRYWYDKGFGIPESVSDICCKEGVLDRNIPGILNFLHTFANEVRYCNKWMFRHTWDYQKPNS